MGDSGSRGGAMDRRDFLVLSGRVTAGFGCFWLVAATAGRASADLRAGSAFSAGFDAGFS